MDHSGGGENEILKIKDINKMREQTTASSRLENGEVQFGELKESETVMVNKENTGEAERSNKAVRRSIKDFILDKPFRIRSYLRRRPIPLKRCLELDVQCGTKSFHLQDSIEKYFLKIKTQSTIRDNFESQFYFI